MAVETSICDCSMDVVENSTPRDCIRKRTHYYLNAPLSVDNPSVRREGGAGDLYQRRG